MVMSRELHKALKICLESSEHCIDQCQEMVSYCTTHSELCMEACKVTGDIGCVQRCNKTMEICKKAIIAAEKCIEACLEHKLKCQVSPESDLNNPTKIDMAGPPIAVCLEKLDICIVVCREVIRTCKKVFQECQTGDKKCINASIECIEACNKCAQVCADTINILG